MKIAWIEVIPTSCGESYAMTDTGIAFYETKEEIEEDIRFLEEEYRRQIEAGERDEGDYEVDFYPKKVLLTEDGRIFDEDVVDITNSILAVMKDVAGITDRRSFIKEIKKYASDVELPPYQEAFGEDYDIGIELTASWEDISYKNDTCPSFIIEMPDDKLIRLWASDGGSRLSKRYNFVE